MRGFENETFEGFDDYDSGATFSDLEFRNCVFQSCSLSNAHTPALRSTVRNIRLSNSSEYGCYVEAAILENIIVDGLNTHGDTLRTSGAVFKHVVLQGKIDYVMTSDLLFGGQATPEEQQAFTAANAAFYEQVDWALDISQGEFKDIDIRGVPGRLVRRDPETQVLITREAALRLPCSGLKLRGPATQIAIDMFLKQGHADLIFLAPKRDRRFRDYLADIELLRKAGLAEPD